MDVNELYNQLPEDGDSFISPQTASKKAIPVMAPFRGVLSSASTQDTQDYVPSTFDHQRSKRSLAGETPGQQSRKLGSAPVARPQLPELALAPTLPTEHVELLHQAQLSQLAANLAPFIAPKVAPSTIISQNPLTSAENAATNTVIGTLTGVDPDSGATALTYTLVDNAGGRFAINASTGVVTVANSQLLNFEAATSHGITVRVTDSDGLNVERAFTITLTNVNEAPDALVLSVGGSVAENAAQGTIVATFTAADPDAGDALTYSLVDDAGGRFTINAATGVVTVANSQLLNYEAATSHGITVRVTDAGGLTRELSQTITLTDVNDAPDALALTSGGLVAENSANGTVVATFTGTDPDALDTLTYSLVDDAGGRFAINASTGVLTLANTTLIDVETATSHSITVRVTDANGLTRDLTQTLTVTDANDAPHALSLTAGGSTAENSVNGAVVATFTGADPDTWDTLTYSLVDNAGGRFAINAATGVVTVANSQLLNYEAATSHSITVRITDAGGLTRDLSQTITLGDVNETPVSLSLTSGGTIAENSANGTVVATFTGSDVDAGDTLTYSLVDNAGGRFAINAATGVVTVANSQLLNFEGATSHGITVRVTDAGGLTRDLTQTITLADVNETPVTLSLSSGGSVAENSANGTVVATFTGSDVDAGDTLTYSLVDNAGGRFAINASTGVVTVANSQLLNFEAATSHSITVRVTDGGGLTRDLSQTLTISDVNEAPVTLSLSSGGSVAENSANGTVVATFSGTDVDAGDTLTYSLTDNAGGRFAINASTGVVTVANSSLLDREAATSHGITVRVTDAGGLTRDLTQAITVSNVNEAPVSLALTAGGTIAENSANGSVVATFTGTDPDAGDTLTYSLVDNAGGRFAINATTGVVTVANSSLLDREAATSHGITVRVTDAGGLTRDLTQTITVTNVNEAPTSLVPINVVNLVTNGSFEADILAPTTWVNLPTPSGWTAGAGNNGIQVFGSEVAGAGFTTTGNMVDMAGGANGVIYQDITTVAGETYVVSFRYAGRPGSESSCQLQVSWGGNVIATLDGGAIPVGWNTYTATLTGAAGGTTRLEFREISPDNNPIGMLIDVVDVRSAAQPTVAENSANGTVVTTFVGTDPDAGDTLTYSLTDNAGGRFAINASTGVVTVANSSLLDREAATSHGITVRVTDAGGLTRDLNQTITLTNVN